MEATVEQKLQALWDLQTIHSKVDKLRILRGELPAEVNDLEDEVEGLQTRTTKLEREIEDLENFISTREHNIKEAKSLIKKYDNQQQNVKNSREFDALTKEVELQNLEVLVSEKRIKEHKFEIQQKIAVLEDANVKLKERHKNLNQKKEELNRIISETQKEEDVLLIEAGEQGKLIEPRLLTAYNRLRANMRNGLAVVSITRSSCSGCFNKIPPQCQADIRQRKKIIVCEHCGRIIIDEKYTVAHEDKLV